MRLFCQLFISILTLILLGCDIDNNVKDAKSHKSDEAEVIRKEKNDYENEILLVKEDIRQLKSKKNKREESYNYSQAYIYSLIKSSHIDHIIIGLRDLKQSEIFLTEKLGFSIKNGKHHKNGITNFFVEFEDSSEIEFMSIQKPADNISINYYNLMTQNKYGFKFVIRTNSLVELTDNFRSAKSDFVVFEENNFYSTLSAESFSENLPFFFIQYKSISNDKINHENETTGISALWLTTPNIRESVEQYSEFGFSLVDTISISDIKSKMALLKNDNFEIILIKGKNYLISGISIKSKDIVKLKSRLDSKLNLDLRINYTKRGKSISLKPDLTNSIWFEFIQN